MSIYLTIFISGGFCGWFIDTMYRTWQDKRFSSNTLVPFFSLIYATATVFLYILFKYFSTSAIGHIFAGLLVVIFLEFLSGLAALIFLKRRFWNYSANRFNFYGLIDLQHSFYWLVLVSLYRLAYQFLF
jgi:uncharacterized membrane protein